MKVLIINGSAHKGNSWTIVEIVKNRMLKLSNNTVIFDEIHLGELNRSMCWGFNRGHELPVVAHSYGGYEPSQKVIEKCNKVAELFYNDISAGKLHSPTFVNILVYNLFRGMSTIGTPEEFCDNRYWKETELINVPYSPKVTVSLQKRLLGNIIFFFARKMAAKTTFTYRK